MRAPRIPEKVVQQQIVRLLRHVGAQVYVIGRPSPNDGRRDRGTGQSPGIPDLFAILPPARTQVSTAVWIEVKAQGGRLRPEQAAFRERCLAARLTHVAGGLDEVIALLVAGGWLSEQHLPHYRQPATPTPKKERH